MFTIQSPALPVKCRVRRAFCSGTRPGCRKSLLSKDRVPPSLHYPASHGLRSFATQPSAAAAGTSDLATAVPVPTANVWELDFCSRPLLDERGKKIWEVLVCDPVRSFSYSRYLPSNKINSGEVRIHAIVRER
jgi:hypothetical protein